MTWEIERKFLVRSEDCLVLASKRWRIRQAYLDATGKASIRVRIRNNSCATLTVKSRPSAIRRLEFEHPIPVLEAEALMPLRQGIVIEKTRYIIPCGELAWEVDVFSGENDGLVIAEIELPDEHHPIERPAWIGAEITGQSQYYNSSLARRPYCSWVAPNRIERRA